MNGDFYERKPWLARYSAGLPDVINPAFDSVLAAFQVAVESTPDLPLVQYFDGCLTAKELNGAADRLACALIAKGFEPGDRLGLFLQNNPAFVIGQLACWKAGGVAVAINPMNKARELTFILNDSGARALLCLDSLYVEVVKDTLAQDLAQVSIVITTSMLDGQSLNDRRILDDAERRPTPSGVLDLREITESHEGSGKFSTVWPSVNDVAMLTYTSGTTGKPKGVMNTHDNLIFNAQAYRDWVGLTSQDKILGIAPLFHVTGAVAHVALSLLTSCPLILAHRFHPDVILDVIRQHRPTFTIGAITAFTSLMNTPGSTRDDFSCFRAVYTGGAPMSPATAEAFEAFSGIYLHNAFGMTETCSPTHLVPFGQKAPVDKSSGAISIGVPIFNTSVRILDDENRTVPVGEIGEIVDSGPQVMRGYWGQPHATLDALEDGWLRTGDVGFMDKDGWFYLVDRKKDMINVSGYKVWPREVEDVLYAHPAVHEAIVVGVPDGYRGETVKAVVSLKPGAAASEKDLIAYCKNNLAAYKYPRILELLPELPKSDAGKLLRRSVR